METASFIIALWGAILSTILGVLAIRKNRLHVIAKLARDWQNRDNIKIEITNLSQRAVIIDSYMLYYGKKKDGYLDTEIEWQNTFTIPPHAFKGISIDPQLCYQFDKSGKLYLELFIKGRKKPKTIRIE